MVGGRAVTTRVQENRSWALPSQAASQADGSLLGAREVQAQRQSVMGRRRPPVPVPQHRALRQEFSVGTNHRTHLSSGRPHAQTRCHALSTLMGIRNPPPPSQPQGGSRRARLPGLLTPGQCRRRGQLGHRPLFRVWLDLFLFPSDATTPPGGPGHLPLGSRPREGCERGVGSKGFPRCLESGAFADGDEAGAGALASLGQGLGGTCPHECVPDAGPCLAPGARTLGTQQGVCAPAHHLPPRAAAGIKLEWQPLEPFQRLVTPLPPPPQVSVQEPCGLSAGGWLHRQSSRMHLGPDPLAALLSSPGLREDS